MAARNEAAKDLRRAKERDAAGAVAALRRPSWIDWALNVVAAEEPAAIEAFATAAETVRDAQSAAMAGQQGADVRGAIRQLREVTAPIVAHADEVLGRQDRHDDRAEVGARLADIAGNGAATDQLGRGLLGSADPGVTDPFADLAPSGGPPASADKATTATTATKATKATKGSKSAKAKAASPADRPSAKERRAAEKAVEAAGADLERAQAAEADAEAAVATARTALAAAQDAVATAERELHEAEAEQERRGEEVARAEAAHDEARAAWHRMDAERPG